MDVEVNKSVIKCTNAENTQESLIVWKGRYSELL